MLMNKVEFCKKNVFSLISPGTYDPCVILHSDLRHTPFILPSFLRIQSQTSLTINLFINNYLTR